MPAHLVCVKLWQNLLQTFQPLGKLIEIDGFRGSYEYVPR
jgi:hypothetical protein